MKTRSIVIVVLLGTLFFLSNIHSQEEMEKIDNSAFENVKRPQVVFNHDEHNEAAELEECNVCHHVYEDGELLEDESSEDYSCSECHDLETIGSQPGLRKAFHLSCKGCHRKLKNGPIKCGKCHVKE